MSSPNEKPDLEESINVAEAHGRVVREAAACAREKPLIDGGRESFPVWAIVACFVASFVAGGVYLKSGAELGTYGAIFRPGYARAAAPGAADSGPVPKEALAAYSAKGNNIYSSKCSGCHGPDAKGNGVSIPSLVGNPWPNGETQRFAMIVLNGLQGPINDGKTYGIMPAQGAGMSAEDLASVMTYVRNNFGNTKGDVVTTEMAQAAIEISAKRKKTGGPVDAEELTADHAKDLPGVVLDAKTLLDPITLAPAKAL
jgi:mono/diheme cytochrome c family protein